MTMNTMKVNGYTAIIRYNPETDEFRGEIQGLNGGADFYGKNPDELRKEFKASLDFFIEVCEKHGRPVKKPASGKLVVHLSSELHQQAVTAAQATGISLNTLIANAVRHELREPHP